MPRTISSETRFGCVSRIGKRQRRTPRAAEDLPFLNANHFSQAFDIGHKIPGRVVLKRRIRRRFATTALVKKDHVVARRIELPALIWRNAATGPTVQKNRWLGAFSPHALPIDGVAIADVEHTRRERFDFRIEGAQAHGR
jgi:hypothetical protein